jgi:hypothetical protein
LGWYRCWDYAFNRGIEINASIGLGVFGNIYKTTRHGSGWNPEPCQIQDRKHCRRKRLA